MTLDEIAKEAITVREAADREAAENDGVISEEMFKALTENEQTIEAKVENCGKYINYLSSQVEIIDKEIERLEARKKSIKKDLEWQKNRTAQFMLAVGKKSVRTPLMTVFCRHTESVDIFDENAIPLDLKQRVVTTTYKVEKKVIKEAIENGQVIPGARIVSKDSLQIR